MNRKILKFVAVWPVILLLLNKNWLQPVFAQQSINGSRISIATPNGKLVQSFNDVVVQINTNTIDIKRVEVSLTRLGLDEQVTEFWDGGEWKLGSAINAKQLARLDQGKWIFNTQEAFSSTDNYKYTVEVNAVSENGRLSYATRTFFIDWSSELTIASPQDGSVLDSVVEMKQVKGTIIPSRGREIKFVRVFLSHKISSGVTEHWNGRAWQNGEAIGLSASLLPKAVSSKGIQWMWDQSDPALAQFADGDYQIEVLAADDKDNTSTAVTRFTLSRTPSVQIETPLSGSILTSAPRVSGSLSLPSVASNPNDEVRIELSQFKLSPISYWNGRQWVKQQKTLPIAIESANQTGSQQKWYLKEIPAFSLMPDGRYRVAAFVYRGAEIISAADTFFEIHRGPVTAIVTPLANSTLRLGKGISAINGTSIKGIDNTPVESVRLALSRLGGNGVGEVWTGRQWQKAPSKAAFSLTLNQVKNGGISWNWKENLPPASSMSVGIYYLTVWSTDSKGRVGATSISFEVRN